ncbi:MAG: hypothetical protein P8166_12610 [Candidatus Thiodiazotropha sp.]
MRLATLLFENRLPGPFGISQHDRDKIDQRFLFFALMQWPALLTGQFVSARTTTEHIAQVTAQQSVSADRQHSDDTALHAKQFEHHRQQLEHAACAETTHTTRCGHAPAVFDIVAAASPFPTHND